MENNNFLVPLILILSAFSLSNYSHFEEEMLKGDEEDV